MSKNVWLLAMTVIPSLLAACGGDAASPNGSNGARGGTGSFTVTSDPATAGEGASYSVKVSFVTSSASCTRTNVGPCQVNPCSGASPDESGPVPDVGAVTLTGADFDAVSLQPAGGGTYAPDDVDGQSGWTTEGQPLAWTWAHAPGDSTLAGGKVTLATPPFITLTKESAFYTAPTTLARDQPLTVTWTAASLPTANDTVLVDVSGPASNGVSTAISCTFEVSAGQGVVPAAALQKLPAGSGWYDVHSKEYLSQVLATSDGTPWTLEFNVDAHAIVMDGVANGSLTLQ